MHSSFLPHLSLPIFIRLGLPSTQVRPQPAGNFRHDLAPDRPPDVSHIHPPARPSRNDASPCDGPRRAPSGAHPHLPSPPRQRHAPCANDDRGWAATPRPTRRPRSPPRSKERWIALVPSVLKCRGWEGMASSERLGARGWLRRPRATTRPLTSAHYPIGP